MASNNMFVTELYPMVEKGLAKKENTVMLKKAVGEYLDRNSEKLTTIGPIYRVIFSDNDIQKLYQAAEVDPNEIKAILKKNPNIKGQWKIMNNPFNSTIALAIRYYEMKKNDDMVNTLLIYLTMSMYPSLHHKYFQFEPNEQVMNYTINNLSNKFKIKQLGTIYAALVDTTQGSYRLHKQRIIRGTDKEIVDFIMDVKTRLNSLLKKLAIEFYRNREQNLYLNTDEDNYDEDNYHEADSNTYAIERVTNNVTLKLVVDGPNMKNVQLAAKSCQVSVSELRNYVNTMVTSENREEIRSVVESILFLYLFDDQNTVREINSTKFLMYCLETYKKSNTTDKNIIRIKHILDKWLEDLGTYKKTQRLATINNFRRALFLFFVISIQTTHN
jgi:hypothetical protein